MYLGQGNEIVTQQLQYYYNTNVARSNLPDIFLNLLTVTPKYPSVVVHILQ